LLNPSGRLILYPPLLDSDLANDRSSILFPLLPATGCSYRTWDTTKLLRVDPAEPGFSDGIAVSFAISLTPYYAGYPATEMCLHPSTGAKILFYSQNLGENRPRPAVIANRPAQHITA